MKIITIAVADEKMQNLEAFLHQEEIKVLEVKTPYHSESDVEIYAQKDAEVLAAMELMEKELEEEIWKLHHFVE